MSNQSTFSLTAIQQQFLIITDRFEGQDAYDCLELFAVLYHSREAKDITNQEIYSFLVDTKSSLLSLGYKEVEEIASSETSATKETITALLTSLLNIEVAQHHLYKSDIFYT